MKHNKYKDVIASDAWLRKSNTYLLNHPICEVCNKFEATQVHHKSYENFGDEDMENEVESICNRCHFHLHHMPPNIDDKESYKKAVSLIDDFIKYPKLKTLILNKVSDKFFNGEFMIDVAHRVAPKTAFMNQNLMEIFYNVGKEKGVDIIEFASKESYLLKMKAGKNHYKEGIYKEKRKKMFENGEIELYETQAFNYATTTIRKPISNKDKIFIFMKNYILKLLRDDQKILSRAKSFANLNYYEGKVYFNAIGVIKPEQFFLKIQKDGFLERLFFDMGGKLPKELEETKFLEEH